MIDEEGKRLLRGGRLQDQRRFRSPDVTRAFSATIRAIAQGGQSEVRKPADVSLEPASALAD